MVDASELAWRELGRTLIKYPRPKTKGLVKQPVKRFLHFQANVF